MKKSKISLVAIILGIISICLISFLGIYVQKANKMENVVKDYTLSKDLKGYREIILKVSDANKVLDSDKKVIGDTDSYNDEQIKSSNYTKSDEKVNSNESRTKENYEETKKIIENRLKDMGVQDFYLSLDKKDGIIYLQVPEDSYTDKIVSNITEIGSVELKDSDDETVLLSNANFNKAVTLYSTQDSGTAVFLELQYNKEGKDILKNLSENDYKTLPEESETEEHDHDHEEETTESEENKEDSKNEDNKESSEENKEETEESKEEKVQKKVALYISGDKTVTTSFDEPIVNGNIDLNMGSATTDADKLSQYVESASRIAVILNNGVLPLKYTVQENRYVKTDISQENIKNVIIAVSIVIGVALIYIIIKFKGKGLLAAICYAGFIALYLLLLRYANVTIALEGIVGAIIISALNYIFTFKILNKKKQYLEELIKLIPLLVISIIFCFAKWTSLISFGMTMFWGIVLIAIYNLAITKYTVD